MEGVFSLFGVFESRVEFKTVGRSIRAVVWHSQIAADGESGRMRRRIEIYLLAYLSLVDFANYAVKSLDETKILSSSECLCMCVCWLCPDEFIFIGFVCCRFFSSAAHDFFEAYSQIPHTTAPVTQTSPNNKQLKMTNAFCLCKNRKWNVTLWKWWLCQNYDRNEPVGGTNAHSCRISMISSRYFVGFFRCRCKNDLKH